jgi:hypothetical protein
LKIENEVTAAASEVERKKTAFFDLADRLVCTSDPTEQERLKEELARMTFGEPE